MKIKASDDLDVTSKPFKDRLIDFRDSKGLTRVALARELGITPITLYRWENGSTRPSPLAAEKLRELGFGTVLHSETNSDSVPRLKKSLIKGGSETHAEELLEAGRIVLKSKKYKFNILTSSFVRNGPINQLDFHKMLLDMQITTQHLPKDVLARRLSLVEEVEGIGKTAQHLLEKPRTTAVSWNSNYGTHGWHRYVGRFPSHVVRALLNYFGADSDSVVCDPFAGSGTTAVECRLLGIPFVGIEICPLSCLMTRTKAAFPVDSVDLKKTAESYLSYYNEKWDVFLGGLKVPELTHEAVLDRSGNKIPTFANIDRWFTPEALLGTSITVEYGLSKDGFERDAILLALSSKMRSIGNVDVDVVRAEYSKQPRANVNVGRLVAKQLTKMSADISASLKSHQDLIGPSSDFKIYEESVLDVVMPDNSIDYIITSPPYGIEAISYLRTHLLSYRTLITQFGHDPYTTRDKTIGSEYMNDKIIDTEHKAGQVSATCKRFFIDTAERNDTKYAARRAAMIQFFDDMLAVGEKMGKWLKDKGQVAFIIGNKRLGDDIIPMDTIVTELFESCGLTFEKAIKHKLKTNNSNSQVPWQERVIQEESILIFRKNRRPH